MQKLTEFEAVISNEYGAWRQSFQSNGYFYNLEKWNGLEVTVIRVGRQNSECMVNSTQDLIKIPNRFLIMNDGNQVHYERVSEIEFSKK